MAFAPYWLIPTLWPLPVPVITKFPLWFPPPLGTLGAGIPPDTVTVPDEVTAAAKAPCRIPISPFPEMTAAPSKEASCPPLVTTPSPVQTPPFFP